MAIFNSYVSHYQRVHPGKLFSDLFGAPDCFVHFCELSTVCLKKKMQATAASCFHGKFLNSPPRNAKFARAGFTHYSWKSKNLLKNTIKLTFRNETCIDHSAMAHSHSDVPIYCWLSLHVDKLSQFGQCPAFQLDCYGDSSGVVPKKRAGNSYSSQVYDIGYTTYSSC